MQEVVLSREVAREVIRCMIIGSRELAKKKAIDMAKALKIAQPVYTRFELPNRDSEGNQLPGAQRLPDLDKLAEIMALLGAADRMPILEQIHAVAKLGTPGGYHTIGLIDQAMIYIALEPHARVIGAYENAGIPGLLQTRQYAETLLRNSTLLRPDFNIERALQLRVARPSILTREINPVHYDCYMDESVLYRVVGGSRLFTDQLEHLLVMSELPNVQLRILPMNLASTGHPDAVAPSNVQLSLVEFTDNWVTSYCENAFSGHFYEAPFHVRHGGRVMGQCDVLAWSAEQSRDRIKRRITEMEGQ